VATERSKSYTRQLSGQKSDSAGRMKLSPCKKIK